MRYLAHIAERVIGRPLMVHPRKAQIIVAALGERIGADDEIDGEVDPVFIRLLRDAPAANRLVGKPGGPVGPDGRVQILYNMVDNVAVIPVVGSLINRGAFIGDDGSGFTSYEGLAVQIAGAVQDTRVGSILLDIESPGGETSGAFTLFETIRAARAVKPVVALVNDMAASAAYGIAASASEIVISPGSITGSIGVMMLHLDRSASMAKKGIKPTFIYAGAKKVDGNSLEPLTDSVRADLQAEVDLLYGQFIDAVIAGRPGLTQDKVRATEAGIFLGKQALDLGFADRMGSFQDTVRGLTARASRAIGGPHMTEQTPKLLSQADIDAAAATARKDGETAGTNAAAARIRSILTHAEAEGREPLAKKLAFDTELTAEAAVALLSASPKAAAASRIPPAAERGQPPLPGGDDQIPKGADASAAEWDAIYDRMNKAQGKQPHPLM